MELTNDLVVTLRGANTLLDVALLVPTLDSEQVTLVRIVGAVHMGLQASEAGDQARVLAWGIYIAGSGSAADMVMDPTSSLDMQSEHWMHLRYKWANTDESGTNTGIDRLADAVDIRVKRKVSEGDGIKLVSNCSAAFTVGARLRGLVLLP